MKRRQFCQSALATAGLMALAPWQRLLAGELNATTLAGQELTINANEVRDLAGGLRGALLLPGDASYGEARLVLNPVIDKHPALIVQPSGIADISLAVQFAQHHRLVTAIKCGGHSYSGRSTVDGGLMIDLSHFRHVRVDKRNRVAHVSGGSLLGAIDHESLAQGLVTTAGTVSHTGVGGLATAAGFGRLARKFGLAIDNVRAVDVVSADGRLRHASASENEDLYWGVRGAGSNFGVVTGFEFDLHPMRREVLAGTFVYPLERLRDLMEFYAEYAADAPDELCVDLVAGTGADGGDGFCLLALCFCGDESAGRKEMARVEALGKPLRGGVQLMDYEVLQRSADNDEPRATATYLKGGFVSEISPALINDIVDSFHPLADQPLMLFFQHAGGAIGRIPADATAFPHRYALANMMLLSSWKPGETGEPHVKRMKQVWGRLVGHTHGFYTVEADDENAPIWNRNYQLNYGRLLDIKRKYDPDNIFRLNANIAPA